MAQIYVSRADLKGKAFYNFFKRFYLFNFRGKGREGEREVKKHQCVRETSMCGCLSRAPNWGPVPNTGLCPDWESKPRPLVYRQVLNPPSHSSQGYNFLIRVDQYFKKTSAFYFCNSTLTIIKFNFFNL